MVPAQKAKVRSVKDGLAGEWLRDCGPDLSPAAVAEFFHLWGILAGYMPVPEQEDAFVWRWSADRLFSVESAYLSLLGPWWHRLLRRFGVQGRRIAASSSLGWCPGTGVGWRTGYSGAACQGCLLAPFATRSRRRSSTSCLVAWSLVRYGWVLTRWGKLEWMPDVGIEVVPWWPRSPAPICEEGYVDGYHFGFLVYLEASERCGVQWSHPAAAAIRHRIREEYQRWRVARLFRWEFFEFPQPFPFCGGGFRLVGELPPLVGSDTCGSGFLALSSI